MNWRNPIVGAFLGLAAMSAAGQAPPTVPAAIPPAAQVPPQSPAAPTSAGAVVFKFKVELLDKDKDGFVSRGEATGAADLLKLFDKLDRNRDGKLSEAELAEYSK